MLEIWITPKSDSRYVCSFEHLESKLDQSGQDLCTCPSSLPCHSVQILDKRMKSEWQESKLNSLHRNPNQFGFRQSLYKIFILDASNPLLFCKKVSYVKSTLKHAPCYLVFLFLVSKMSFCFSCLQPFPTSNPKSLSIAISQLEMSLYRQQIVSSWQISDCHGKVFWGYTVIGLCA